MFVLIKSHNTYELLQHFKEKHEWCGGLKRINSSRAISDCLPMPGEILHFPCTLDENTMKRWPNGFRARGKMVSGGTWFKVERIGPCLTRKSFIRKHADQYYVPGIIVGVNWAIGQALVQIHDFAATPMFFSQSCEWLMDRKYGDPITRQLPHNTGIKIVHFFREFMESEGLSNEKCDYVGKMARFMSPPVIVLRQYEQLKLPKSRSH